MLRAVTSAAGGSSGLAAPAMFGGRLTLATATPVMTSSVSAATTAYYTPYLHNRISLPSGSDLVLFTFSELSNITTNSAVGNAGPAAVAASSVYDYFVWNNGGTLALTRGPAWTNATTRSLTLTRVAGVWTNTSAITNGPLALSGTYVGTASSNASSQLNFVFGTIAAGGGAAILTVWNMFNRVMTASGGVGDSTDTWTVASTGYTLPNNGAQTGMTIKIVRGLNEDAVQASYNGVGIVLGSQITVAVGLDSTSVMSGTSGMMANFNANATVSSAIARYDGLAGIGVHDFNALEAFATAGTHTGIGDNGAPTLIQNLLFLSSLM